MVASTVVQWADLMAEYWVDYSAALLAETTAALTADLMVHPWAVHLVVHWVARSVA